MPNQSANPSLPITTPGEYHTMVLLVDDQAMVCEAVRRALANERPSISIIVPTRAKRCMLPHRFSPP